MPGWRSLCRLGVIKPEDIQDLPAGIDGSFRWVVACGVYR